MIEDLIYQTLKQRLNRLHDDLKAELAENKKSVTADLMVKIQRDLEDEIQKMSYGLQGLQKVEKKIVNALVTSFYELLVQKGLQAIEMLVVLCCKKQNIPMNPNLFEEQEDKSKFVFKSKDLMMTAVDVLPKEVKTIVKLLIDLLKKKEINQFVEEFIKNEVELGIKIQTDKKSEKNFWTIQKYSLKEGDLFNQILDAKTFQNDVKKKVQVYLNQMLHEKNIYLISKYSDDFCLSLAIFLKNILMEDEKIEQNLAILIDLLKSSHSNECEFQEVLNNLSK